MGSARYERTLVNAFDQCGWSAMRAAASGSATSRELPDVLAMKAQTLVTKHGHDTMTRCLAIEVKACGQVRVYIGEDEVEKLQRFARTAGGEARIGVRFKYKGTRSVFWLLDPEYMDRTPEGNYAVHKDKVEDQAVAKVLPETTPADPDDEPEPAEYIVLPGRPNVDDDADDAS